ncbi:hypothetical protein GCM10009422_18880 [Brevundimonas kwangchunensis]|uniref:Lipoprotein n=1 Tax=Brevundimonas kwangchunensis TaxID=322163 RepID=A0ABN1GXX3_9CAUL
MRFLASLFIIPTLTACASTPPTPDSARVALEERAQACHAAGGTLMPIMEGGRPGYIRPTNGMACRAPRGMAPLS